MLIRQGRSEINDANNILNPIYTRGIRIVVLYVMVLQPYGFRFAFKMLYKEGEGLPVVGEGGWEILLLIVLAL
jgi:hypothetical protein